MGVIEAMSSVGGIFIPIATRRQPQTGRFWRVSSRKTGPAGTSLSPAPPELCKKFSESRLVLRIELRFALHPRFCISSYPCSHVLF